MKYVKYPKSFHRNERNYDTGKFNKTGKTTLLIESLRLN